MCLDDIAEGQNNTVVGEVGEGSVGGKHRSLLALLSGMGNQRRVFSKGVASYFCVKRSLWLLC